LRSSRADSAKGSAKAIELCISITGPTPSTAIRNRIKNRAHPESAFKAAQTLLKLFAMKLDRFNPRTVLFLIALAVYATCGFPQNARAQTKDFNSLRFGQTIALSDFDSDGLLDEARLYGTGLHKRIGIKLSSSGEHISLQFAVKLLNHGSLFARDLDEDGSADLIWTDLVHSESVIVWLGDGYGNFSRSTSRNFNSKFALAGQFITTPVTTQTETAAGCDDNRLFVVSPAVSCTDYDPLALDRQCAISIVSSSPSLEYPSDRGPPLR